MDELPNFSRISRLMLGLLVFVFLGVVLLLAVGLSDEAEASDEDINCRYVGKYESSEYAHSIAFDNDHVFLGVKDQGLLILNVSEKGKPELVGNYSGNWDYVFDVQVADGYAYLAVDGLVILDVSNLSQPRFVSNYSGDVPYPRALAVSGEHVYLTGGSDGLEILDISNKTNPKHLATFDTRNQEEDVEIRAERAFVSTSQGMHIINISQKDNPTELGWFESGNIRGIDIKGTHAYLVKDFSQQLIVVNISNETDPWEEGSRYLGSSGNARDLLVSGSLAYIVGSGEGLIVMNISDPGDPYKIDKYKTGDSLDLAFSGDYIYLAQKYARFRESHNGLEVVELAPWEWIDAISPKTTLPDQTVSFEGHYRNEEDAVRYVWKSDIDGELHNGSEPDFSKYNHSLGQHRISFRVQNSSGEWSNGISASLMVHLKPEAVIDSVFPNPTRKGEPIFFSGNGTDDGSIEDYYWQEGTGRFLNNSQSFNVSDLPVGLNTIMLRVKDNNGAWSEDVSVTVTVLGKPVATIQALGEGRLAAGKATLFRADGSSETGNITRYLWMVNGEPVYNGTEQETIIDNLTAGEQEVQLRVMDNYGLWSDPVSMNITVHLSERPVASNASENPSPVLEGESVSFEALGTDDGSVVRYVWSHEGEELYNGSQATFSSIALTSGHFTDNYLDHLLLNISLKVQDNHGYWSDELATSLRVNRIIERSLPELNISSPEEGTSINASVKVSGTAWPSELQNSLGVEINIGGDGWKKAVVGSRNTDGNDSWYYWHYSWDSTKTGNGETLIRARAKDGAGISSIVSLNVSVYNEPGPDIGGDDPENGEKEDKHWLFEKEFYITNVLPFVLLILLFFVVSGTVNLIRKANDHLSTNSELFNSEGLRTVIYILTRPRIILFILFFIYLLVEETEEVVDFFSPEQPFVCFLSLLVPVLLIIGFLYFSSGPHGKKKVEQDKQIDAMAQIMVRQAREAVQAENKEAENRKLAPQLKFYLHHAQELGFLQGWDMKKFMDSLDDGPEEFMEYPWEQLTTTIVSYSDHDGYLVDWKFSSDDVLWSTNKCLQPHGMKIEKSVLAGDDEVLDRSTGLRRTRLHHLGRDYSLEFKTPTEIMKTVNSIIASRGLVFLEADEEDDNYQFVLVKKRFVEKVLADDKLLFHRI